MKILVTEIQYSNIIEPFIQEQDLGLKGKTLAPKYAPPKRGQANPEDTHTMNTVLQIASAFIPYVGPFVSAGIGAADAGLYWNEGDKTSAVITGVFSFLPFLTFVPGAKELGSKGMSLLADKLLKGGANLTKAEAEIVNAVKMFTPKIQEELTKMAPKLKNVVKELNLYKPNFVKKFGEAEYNKLLAKFLYDGIDQKTFLNTLKNVKSPTIKVKPVLGGGRDHRVFQSAIHPDRVIKAEVRPGEVDKWYDVFNNNQKIFAKPFSKTKIKNTDGTMLSAVVMEKLNTLPFTNMWDSMEKLLMKMPGNTYSTLEYVVKNIGNPIVKKTWDNLAKYIKQQDPSIASKVDEFYKMVDELYKITPKPDIRQFNFGYNKEGILKALDI
jgi:hypothetical protein